MGGQKLKFYFPITDGPNEPEIRLNPSKSLYFVGDLLTIQCIIDSNPPPVFTWKFHPHNKSLESVIENSWNVSKLVFNSLQTKDSGIYSCTATNAARPISANMISSVSFYVRHSEIRYQGCNQCGYLKVCQQYDGKIECVTNKWVPIAIVFILISVSFAATSIVLIKNKRQRSKSITYSNIVPSQRYKHIFFQPSSIQKRIILFNINILKLTGCVLGNSQQNNDRIRYKLLKSTIKISSFPEMKYFLNNIK